MPELAGPVRPSVRAPDAAAGRDLAAERIAVAAFRRRTALVDIPDGRGGAMSSLVVDHAAVRAELRESDGDVPGLYVVFERGHAAVRAGTAARVAAVVADADALWCGPATEAAAAIVAGCVADTGAGLDGGDISAVRDESFERPDFDEFVSVLLALGLDGEEIAVAGFVVIFDLNCIYLINLESTPINDDRYWRYLFEPHAMVD